MSEQKPEQKPVVKSEFFSTQLAKQYGMPPRLDNYDPTYVFERKGPDQFPRNTAYNSEKGSNLTGKMSRDREFRPGEGTYSSATIQTANTTATGYLEIHNHSGGSPNQGESSASK